MMTKTTDLIGAALDWAVAKCEGSAYHGPAWTKYSTDWSQGGPIIERERVDLFTEKGTTPDSWVASIAQHQNGHRLVGWRLHQYGPTPLIAAMRCYVASKLGDEIDVPDELI
jgi:hypothetical protein